MAKPSFLNVEQWREVLLSPESSPEEIDSIANDLVFFLDEADSFWRNRWSHPASSMIMSLGLLEMLELLLVDERLSAQSFMNLLYSGWWPANPFCLSRPVPAGVEGDKCFVAGAELVGDLSKVGMDNHLFGAQDMVHGLWIGFLLFADAVERRKFAPENLKAMITPLWKVTLVLKVVAANVDMPVDSLVLLAKHPVPSVREAVRLNTSTPVEVAVELALKSEPSWS